MCCNRCRCKKEVWVQLPQNFGIKKEVVNLELTTLWLLNGTVLATTSKRFPQQQKNLYLGAKQSFQQQEKLEVNVEFFLRARREVKFLRQIFLVFFFFYTHVVSSRKEKQQRIVWMSHFHVFSLLRTHLITNTQTSDGVCERFDFNVRKLSESPNQLHMNVTSSSEHLKGYSNLRLSLCSPVKQS